MRLGWYSDLTPVERRTYWACFGGFGLDSMDTTMYALVIPSLITVLGITRPEAGYLATAALVGAAAGGWGAGMLAGPLMYGWLSDRIGRRFSFMAFLLLQGGNVAIYLLTPIGLNTSLLLSFFLGAFQGGLASGMLPTFAELFPTAIRANGQGFCLGGGRGFGSVVPATVGILAATLPLGTAMGTCALCAYAVAFLAALLLPEFTAPTQAHGSQFRCSPASAPRRWSAASTHPQLHLLHVPGPCSAATEIRSHARRGRPGAAASAVLPAAVLPIIEMPG